MTRSIELLEVGPRDGLQREPGVVPTAVKAELIERLLRAGLKRIEVTSFVNPKKVPQMADAEELLSRLKRPEGVWFTGLVLNRKGLDRAIAAGCNEIGMVVVASDTFNRRNQGVSNALWSTVKALPELRSEDISGRTERSNASHLRHSVTYAQKSYAQHG